MRCVPFVAAALAARTASPLPGLFAERSRVATCPKGSGRTRAAAPRPSLKAQTTRLWPRRQSPAAKTPLMLVAYLPCSALTLVRGSRSTPRSSSSGCFGPEEAHRQQDELRGQHLLGARNFLGTNWPLSLRSHSTCTVTHRLDLAVGVADEFLGGGQIDARIVAELRGGFFLAVVELVDLRPFRPRIVLGALQRRLRQDFELHEALAAMAHRGADAVGAGVAAADDDDVLARGVDEVAVLVRRRAAPWCWRSESPSRSGCP